jgi:hypothetical protein
VRHLGFVILLQVGSTTLSTYFGGVKGCKFRRRKKVICACGNEVSKRDKIPALKFRAAGLRCDECVSQAGEVFLNCAECGQLFTSSDPDATKCRRHQEVAPIIPLPQVAASAGQRSQITPAQVVMPAVESSAVVVANSSDWDYLLSPISSHFARFYVEPALWVPAPSDQAYRLDGGRKYRKLDGGTLVQLKRVQRAGRDWWQMPRDMPPGSFFTLLAQAISRRGHRSGAVYAAVDVNGEAINLAGGVPTGPFSAEAQVEIIAGKNCWGTALREGHHQCSASRFYISCSATIVEVQHELMWGCKKGEIPNGENPHSVTAVRAAIRLGK